MKWGLKGGISIYADSGPPRYVLWCCGGICHELLTFIKIGCGHTVALPSKIHSIFLESSCQADMKTRFKWWKYFLLYSKTAETYRVRCRWRILNLLSCLRLENTLLLTMSHFPWFSRRNRTKKEQKNQLWTLSCTQVLEGKEMNGFRCPFFFFSFWRPATLLKIWSQ